MDRADILKNEGIRDRENLCIVPCEPCKFRMNHFLDVFPRKQSNRSRAFTPKV